jgi:cyclic pyranopterin phosphate synthase
MSLRKGSGTNASSSQVARPQVHAGQREMPGSAGSGSPKRIPGLSVVEIEVGSRCNRACSYCPVALNPRPPVPARMSDQVYLRVMQRLADVGFAGRLSYHLYNEPLLRKDLPRLVAIAHSWLPEALQILNTNGDLLTDERYNTLRQAGVDYFYVTRHSGGDFPQRPFQIVQTGQDLILTNRGGTVAQVPLPSLSARKTPCFAPSEMLIVTVTGDVMLCYEDAERAHIMGNLMLTPLPEIWYSKSFTEHRERLSRGDRTVEAMCLRCSNVSHSSPGLSALENSVVAATGISRGPAAIGTLKLRSTKARSA